MHQRWPDRVAVRIAPDQRAALLRLAEVEQRTASSIVREAVADLLRERAHRLDTVEV